MDFGGRVQVASVSFVGIDMDFEFAGRIGSNQQVVEGDRALGGADHQRHEVTILDSVVGCVLMAHVNMSGRSYDTLGQFNGAGWSNQYTAWGSLNVAAMSNGGVDAKRDGIGIGQLDLAVFACRTQDSDVGKHTSTRADDHHGFLGRVESVLVQVLADRQFLAWTKQLFNVLIGEMDMARRDADDQPRCIGSSLRQCAICTGLQNALNCIAHQRFDSRTINSGWSSGQGSSRSICNKVIELLVMMESMARIGLRIGIGGFGCIGWDGRLLDRGEKQLRAVVSKGCSPVFRERIVGDNSTDFAKGTEFGQARSTKLTAIGHDDGLIRATHHGSFGFDQQQVAVVVSAFVGARDAEHRFLDVQRLKHLIGVGTERHAGARVDVSTEQNQIDRVRRRKQIGYRK